MTLLALAPPVSDFVGAMRAAVTGVNVVTTDGAGGRLGRTVSALASVSAEPENPAGVQSPAGRRWSAPSA